MDSSSWMSLSMILMKSSTRKIYSNSDAWPGSTCSQVTVPPSVLALGRVVRTVMGSCTSVPPGRSRPSSP